MSGTLAGISMKKLETDVVEPERPILYRRYVGDVYRRRLKNRDDTLFRKLNSYHTNTKFTVDPNPEQFLDSAIHREGNNITTSVYTKPNKLPIPWTSRTPKKYKRNSLKTELYRAKQISSDFDAEVDQIKTKFQNAAYPKHFIASAIKEFNTPEDTDTIPPWLFEDRQTILIRLPYCEKNEQEAYKFTDKLSVFTQNKYIFRIIWNTKKIRALFPLKDRNMHRSTVIYEGKCTICNEIYIGETDRNSDIRWTEHNTPSTRSDPAKHLLSNPDHSFIWSIIASAPKQNFKRKILEHLHIAKYQPTINDQKSSDILLLFKFGIT